MLGGADNGAVATKPTPEDVENAVLEADAEQVLLRVGLDARTAATAKARAMLVPTGVLGAERERQGNICARLQQMVAGQGTASSYHYDEGSNKEDRWRVGALALLSDAERLVLSSSSLVTVQKDAHAKV